MKLHRLTLAGFGSYTKEETIDFTGIQVASITGENHSGKSTVLRAIEYALYGPRRGEAAELVGRGCKQMQVKLCFSADGHEWQVLRSHRIGGTGHRLQVIVDEEPLPGKEVAVLQQSIIDAIGMDRDVARATWMAMQGEIDLLATLDGPGRRQVFTRVFRLDRFDRLLQVAKAERKAADREVQQLQGELRGLQQAVRPNPELARFGDEDLAAMLDHWQAWRERDQLMVRRDRLTERLDDIESKMEELELLTGQGEKVQQALDRRTGALEQARVHADECQSRLAQVDAEHKQLRSQQRAARQALAAVDDMRTGHCDQCGQTLTEQARDFMRAQASRALDDIDAQCATISEQAEDVRQASRQASQEMESWRQKVTSAQHRLQQVEAAARELLDARQRRTQLLDELSDLPEVEQLRAAPEVSAEDARNELGCRKVARDNQQRAQRLAASVDSAEQRLHMLGVLVAAWQPSGIPMTMLRGLAGEVSDDANALLAAMGSPLVLDLDTSGAGVELLVQDASWTSLSGQERFFVAFALRRALRQVVARRSHESVECMLVDEGWGALDHEHAGRAVQALLQVAGQEQFLTVTHLDEVASQMPSRFEVTARSGTSKVTRLG